LYGLDRNFSRIKTAQSLIQNAPQPSTSTTPNIDDHDYSLQKYSTLSAENIDIPHSSSQTQSTNCITKTTKEDSKDQIEEKMVGEQLKDYFIFHYVFRLIL
jgi:hypothetical protein